MLRYEVWRGRDNRLHVMCFEGRWDTLPLRITQQGPWTGGGRGFVEDLKCHYRALLMEQGFCVLHQPPSVLDLERWQHRVVMPDHL